MVPKRFGRYEVHEEIGEGAMGRVYSAFDPVVQRVVAIKTVRSEYLGRGTRDEYLQRFRREAQAAGCLAHPHIVGIFDVGEDYLVMELVEGRTLEDVLDQGPLDLPRALDLLTPLAEAIDYAHQAGVIHHDIKPGNIMVEPNGRPKLMDFGVARVVPAATPAEGPLVGSPSYMAPEQVRNAEVTHRSDLFSFAVVAYEAMTGHRPFKGDSIATIVHHVANDAAPSPRSWNPSLPTRYDVVFERALAKDPAQRFESALSFMAALKDEGLETVSPHATAVAEPSLGAKPSPPDARDSGSVTLPPIPLPSHRRWLSWLGAGAALVVLSLAVAWSLRRPVASREDVRVNLRIEAEPGGASVWVDGARAGSAPLTLKDLRPGPHQVRVIEEGYAPAELGLEITEGMTAPPLRFVMAPQPGQPRIAPSPPPPAGRPAPSLPVSVPTVKKPLVRGAFVELDETMTPPRHVSGEPAPYPQAARKLRLKGSVLVEMIVTEDGQPRDLRVLESAGAILDQAVVEAVERWRFKPALKQGTAVRVHWKYKQSFVPAL